MRSFILFPLLFVAATSLAEAKGGHSSGGSHYVRPYTTSNGVHVQGHHATNPNGTRADNWSTKGNVNPYTGKAGTKPLVPLSR